jgi:hypothetical protein
VPPPAQHLHPVAPGGAQGLPRRQVGVELLAVLVEAGDLQVRAQADRARVGLELARQQLEQGGLAGAVRADDADAVAA